MLGGTIAAHRDNDPKWLASCMHTSDNGRSSLDFGVYQPTSVCVAKAKMAALLDT